MELRLSSADCAVWWYLVTHHCLSLTLTHSSGNTFCHQWAVRKLAKQITQSLSRWPTIIFAYPVRHTNLRASGA